eukprot:582464-Amorphochlora_amoeboformis.AAC.1
MAVRRYGEKDTIYVLKPTLAIALSISVYCWLLVIFVWPRRTNKLLIFAYISSLCASLGVMLVKIFVRLFEFPAVEGHSESESNSPDAQGRQARGPTPRGRRRRHVSKFDGHKSGIEVEPNVSLSDSYESGIQNKAVGVRATGSPFSGSWVMVE